MKHYLIQFVTCLSLFSLTLPAYADTNPAQQQPIQQKIPFSIVAPKDFQKQNVQVQGVSVWVGPNACALTLLTGKSNIESYLWGKIYENKDNLDAYYQKLAKQDGVEPQKISKVETVKTKEQKEITVYQSQLIIDKKSFNFWDGLYVADGNYASLLLQCPSSGLSNKQALAIFSSLHAEPVTSLADEIKALPFQITTIQPYYISSTSSAPPKFAAVSLKQAINQINEWPETEVFVNYDSGPFTTIPDFIDNSFLAEQLELNSRDKKQEIKATLENKDRRTYVFDAKDGKNTSLIMIKRSEAGEILVTLAIINSDKLTVYRPIIETMDDRLTFISDKNKGTLWKHNNKSSNSDKP